MNHMDVDYVSGLGQIGTLLTLVTGRDRGPRALAPQDVMLESQIAEKTAVGIEVVEQIADKSVFACPDCGGNLWAIKEDVFGRYRCHIGHAYSERDLVVRQAETASSTLWMALRMMEERRYLLRKLAVDYAPKKATTLYRRTMLKEKMVGAAYCYDQADPFRFTKSRYGCLLTAPQFNSPVR